jgi:hypothetical protein
MAESTAQSLRRRPFEVAKRVKDVAYVESRLARDDRVCPSPQWLDALSPCSLLWRQVAVFHIFVFACAGPFSKQMPEKLQLGASRWEGSPYFADRRLGRSAGCQSLVQGGG